MSPVRGGHGGAGGEKLFQAPGNRIQAGEEAPGAGLFSGGMSWGRCGEREGLSLCPPQSELLDYLHLTIDKMAQRCSRAAHRVPESLGLFSKLDWIKVRPDTGHCPQPTLLRPPA